jgi:hypothetical protein
MLTIFTIPKPFAGEADRLQRNAIRSWRELAGVQTILCGDEPGVAEAALEFGCDHAPALRRSDYGTPRLDDAFAAAERLAAHRLLCFINSDILLAVDFRERLRSIAEPAFLLAGRRINLWLEEDIDFRDAGWRDALLAEAARNGTWAQQHGSDYFIFRRGTLGDIPPFLVGRPAWDNWMMFHARERRWPLIDGTECIRAIHQNHDYGHVPHSRGPMWEGPEADYNLRLAGGYDFIYGLADATHVLGPDGPEPLDDLAHRLRRLRRLIERMPGVRAAYRLRRRVLQRAGGSG